MDKKQTHTVTSFACVSGVRYQATNVIRNSHYIPANNALFTHLFITLLVGEKLCRVITLLVGEKFCRIITLLVGEKLCRIM